MQTYRCFKVVQAFMIAAITDSYTCSDSEECTVVLRDANGAGVTVNSGYLEKHKPAVGGYFVRYEDGYESFSPAAAFEAGYAPVGDEPPIPTKVTREALEARIRSVEYVVMPDGRTTICQMTMINGFTVRGESSCVSIENFVKAEGEKYAREKAIDAAWAFEGYLLAERRLTESREKGSV